MCFIWGKDEISQLFSPYLGEFNIMIREAIKIIIIIQIGWFEEIFIYQKLGETREKRTWIHMKQPR